MAGAWGWLKPSHLRREKNKQLFCLSIPASDPSLSHVTNDDTMTTTTNTTDNPLHYKVSYKANKFETRHGVVLADAGERVQVLWVSHTSPDGKLHKWVESRKTWISKSRLA